MGARLNERVREYQLKRVHLCVRVSVSLGAFMIVFSFLRTSSIAKLSKFEESNTLKSWILTL